MSDRSGVKALLQGAYDLHVHAAPSPFHRGWDDFQLLQMAGTAGMAGILLKSHYEPTAARTEIANHHAGSTARAYGALVLNHPVGGLDPYAVYNALERGTRYIFMPTRDSANSLSHGNMPGDFFDRPGISITDEGGELLPEVYDILAAVKERGAVLATGHISPAESIQLCKTGAKMGVRMVLTHPEFSRTHILANTQRELAKLGVIIEKCWYNIAEGEVSAAEMTHAIHTVGPEHCYLSTDRGQSGRETPVEGMLQFIETLAEQGLTYQELYTMTHTVPASLVN